MSYSLRNKPRPELSVVKWPLGPHVLLLAQKKRDFKGRELVPNGSFQMLMRNHEVPLGGCLGCVWGGNRGRGGVPITLKIRDWGWGRTKKRMITNKTDVHGSCNFE